MQMTAQADSGRFQSGADKYASYLETPEGRLRCDLAFANLQDFLPLPQTKLSLRALDLGCGTGAAAVRLARLGINVTLLDSSPAMLEIAKRTARKAGVDGKIELKHGDAAQVANLFLWDRSTSFFATTYWNTSTIQMLSSPPPRSCEVIRPGLGFCLSWCAAGPVRC
jgi:ubiquinone/menaquinone biosynthesis C-methylase UbiE